MTGSKFCVLTFNPGTLVPVDPGSPAVLTLGWESSTSIGDLTEVNVSVQGCWAGISKSAHAVCCHSRDVQLTEGLAPRPDRLPPEGFVLALHPERAAGSSAAGRSQFVFCRMLNRQDAELKLAVVNPLTALRAELVSSCGWRATQGLPSAVLCFTSGPDTAPPRQPDVHRPVAPCRKITSWGRKRTRNTSLVSELRGCHHHGARHQQRCFSTCFSCSCSSRLGRAATQRRLLCP